MGSIGFFVIEENVFSNISKEVEDYCNNKYERSFKWVDFNLEDSTLHSKVSNVEDEDGVVFKVVRSYTEESKVIYKDNYMGHKSEGYIKSCINEIIPNSCKYIVNIDSSVFMESKDGSIDVNEFVSNPDTVVNIYFEDSVLWSKEQIEDFCCKLPFRISATETNGVDKIIFATDKDKNVVYR